VARCVRCFRRRARDYLCAAKVLLKDFSRYAQTLTARVKDTAITAARTAGRPYLFLRLSSCDKLALARGIAVRDHIDAGLIAVFSALEPCLAVTVRGDRDSGRLVPEVQRRQCLHLYHYLQHPSFGLCHVRVQTWLPFTVEVWLNGREWLARQMDAEGLAYVQRENGFTHLADPAAAQLLFERQHRVNWPKLLGELLDQTHPLHRAIIAPLPFLGYYWAVTQSEYATDLLCADRATLAGIYPQFVHHALTSFSSPDIMRFLGHVAPAHTGRVNGRFKGELHSKYLVRPEGVRLKHRVGHNTLKVYDKHGQVLRVETTLNAPEVFKVWRRPSGQPRARRSARRRMPAICRRWRPRPPVARWVKPPRH
jgi:hypothetical protein